MNTESKKQPGLHSLIALAASQKEMFAASVMLAVIGQGCGIVPFFVIYRIIIELSSKALNEIDQSYLYLLIFAAFSAIILKHFCLGISTAISHISAYNILYDLRVKLVEKLRRLPLGYFNNKNSGQIKKVLSEDVEQMEVFLAHNIPEFISAVLYTLLTAVVLFIVDWRLALATVLVIPFGFIVQMITMTSGREFSSKWVHTAEKMNAAMIEYIQGMPIIKAFNHTVTSFTKYSTSIEECLAVENEWCRRWYLSNSIFSVSITANMLLLLPLGAIMYLMGVIAPAKLVFFLLMGIGFGSPVWLMIQFGRAMERNLECQTQIEAILTEAELSEPVNPAIPGKGAFAKNIVFSYDRKTKVIDGVDFAISDGKFVALVGPSGAGKTTLARLIPRFWDINSGSLSIGKTDIRTIKTDVLMDQFALIFQNIFLFNDTVLVNLQLGKPDAAKTEVIEAARAAGCHDFIMKLPKGYNTIIGEKGARISGGEKQRLSIARALLKDSPILILDEATAFIDPENEAVIQDAINKLIQHKTLIVIAHRISTIIGADEILVLNNGLIAASGTHDQLLSTSKLYKKMWLTHISAQGWNVERGIQ